MRCHYTPTKTSKIKKKNNLTTPTIDEDLEQLELPAPVAQVLRTLNGAITLENSLEIPQMVKHRVTMTQQPKRNEGIFPHRDLYMVVHSSYI